MFCYVEKARRHLKGMHFWTLEADACEEESWASREQHGMCDNESCPTRKQHYYKRQETFTMTTGFVRGTRNGTKGRVMQHDTLPSVALRQKLEAKYGHFLKSEHAREKEADAAIIQKRPFSLLPRETEDSYDDDYVPNRRVKQKLSTAKKRRQKAVKRRPKTSAAGGQRQTRESALRTI